MKSRAIQLLSLVIITATTSASCDKESDHNDQILNRELKIKNFFQNLKGGSNPDYAVVKNGVFGKNPTIIIYGYTDNRDTCEDIVNLFESSKKDNFFGKYSCEPLN